MRRTFRPQPPPRNLISTAGRTWLLGVLVLVGWAGCTADSKGIASPKEEDSGRSAAGGQSGDASENATAGDGTIGDASIADAAKALSPDAAEFPTPPMDGGAPSPGGGQGGNPTTSPGAAGQGGAIGTGGQGTNGASSSGGAGARRDAGSPAADARTDLPGLDIDRETKDSGGKIPPDTALADAFPLDTAPDSALDTTLPDAATPDASTWHLTWADEFDGDLQTGADPSKWNASTWDPGTVNNESQKYTARLQNIFHDGQGHLILRALNDPYTDGSETYPYTSGRLQTDGKFSFKFGRVEISAKLPAGKGSFPGLILMGSKGSWPQCGEIALMEQKGQDKSTLVCSTYSGSQSDISKDVSFPSATSLSEQFHLYAIEWFSDRVVFFIDGVEVARRPFSASSPFATSDNPFYVIVDVALGGNMGGAIDDSAFPMEMVLDYVRVYAP